MLSAASGSSAIAAQPSGPKLARGDGMRKIVLGIVGIWLIRRFVKQRREQAAVERVADAT